MSEEPLTRHPRWLQFSVVLLTLAALLLAVNQLFNVQLFGLVILDTRYLYVLAGIFLCLTFLLIPARKTAYGRLGHSLDYLLALLSLVVAAYFAWSAEQSLLQGWEYAAPPIAQGFSYAFWLLILEAARRAGGGLIFAVIVLFSLYPTFADKVPGPISGFAQPLGDTVVFHMLSTESAFGIPMRAFGELVIGFILFGAVLQHTGGGRFFNDLAFALVGRFRGGAAKVAIFASGFMGSMSGSVISNVLTTGAVSIPAMRRSGFAPHYAAATEACASTGGVLMPPIMGTTAFVMASFLGMPYAEIALAAAVPSLLFYFGLFVQIDAYAARRELRGLSAQELPQTRQVLRQGWPYLLVFALLIGFLLILRRETQAPFYATAALLLINQLLPQQRLNIASFVALVIGVGKALAELVAVLLGVGLIVGAFSATGLAGTLVNDLIFLAGGSLLMLLLMGALTSFVFGMGMTVTACYIFLAIVLAPALVRAGLDPLAVHLFILYWGMVSYITPPVALGAFAAANLAGTSPMKAGLEAMRLGGIIYIVPFFFVLNPALIGRGTLAEFAGVLLTAVAGVWFIGSALQGYVAGLGPLSSGLGGWLMRVVLAVAGLSLALPGNATLGLNHWMTALFGLALATPVLVLCYRAAQRG